MIKELTPSELRVAEETCKCLNENEVGENIFLSPYTVRVHKYRIYKKLGINKEIELLYYMLCRKMGIDFDIKEVHKKGLSLFFSMLFLVIQVVGNDMDMRMPRSGRTVRTTMVRRAKQ